MSSLIVFDGECRFCNRTIMFIARNDINNYFKFISSSSNFGIELLEKHKIKGIKKSTIILIEKENIYTKSIAIREVFLKIPKYRIIGLLLFMIPKKISDIFYDFTSKYRKRLIKNNACEIPPPEIREKFIL